jgi:hypothetical protein
MGVHTVSSRVELTLPSSMGEIVKIARIVNDMGLTIMSIISTVDKDKSDTRTTIIRVNTDDIKELCEALEKSGYSPNKEYSPD